MFLPILPRHIHAVLEMFLERGIHDEFLADRVAGQLPGELVLVRGLLGGVRGADDFVEVGFQLAVVLDDCVADAGTHGGGCWGEGSLLDECDDGPERVRSEELVV